MSRILVLHDKPDFQMAIVNALEDAGHDAIAGALGRDALEDVEGWYYDLLIIDVLKRDISAWYLMRRARRARPNAQIIALCQSDTMLPAGTLAHLSRLHGADAILSHPIETEALWRLVSTLIGTRAPKAAERPGA